MRFESIDIFVVMFNFPKFYLIIPDIYSKNVIILYTKKLHSFMDDPLTNTIFIAFHSILFYNITEAVNSLIYALIIIE